MKLTHIYHSGILMQLDTVNILFDYYKGDIPKMDMDKDLLVMVSHRHPDHFSKDIFGLSSKYPKAIYVLSDDIWERYVPHDLYGRVQFMGPDEELDIKLPNTDVYIRSYKSTDEGVAFLIDTDGKRIYHAGDLNYWYWEEEGEEWNNNQKANYEKELAKIAEVTSKDGKQVDYACIPLDSRLGEHYYLGMDTYMNMVGCKVIIPMHMFDDYGIIDHMKKRKETGTYADRILDVKHKNQSFEV